jgi:hypothetical protein
MCEAAGQITLRIPMVGQSAISPIDLADTYADVALGGERKTVTALFAYIKGSMDLM